MTQYVVHIGYPKSASTFLQGTVFSGQDKRIQPLDAQGKKRGASVKSGSFLFDGNYGYEEGHLKQKNMNPFLFDVQRAKKTLCDLTPNGAEIVCLSNEDWVGHPFSGGVNAKEYADRIKAVVPDAKIIISIREQVGMILSCYAHYLVKCSGVCSLKTFLQTDSNRQHFTSNLYYFCYAHLVAYYIDLFGDENVLVLPFEKLGHAGEGAFLEDVFSFLGLDPVEFRSQKSVKNQRDYSEYTALRMFPVINFFAPSRAGNGNVDLECLSFVKSIYLKVVRMFASEKKVCRTLQQDKEIITALGKDIFASNNQRLQKMIGIDLEKYGYILPQG